MSRSFWYEHDAAVNGRNPSLYHPDGPDAALLQLHLDRAGASVQIERLDGEVADLHDEHYRLQLALEDLQGRPLEGNRRTGKGGLSNPVEKV